MDLPELFMDLPELQEKLKNIKSRGYVKSLRCNDTGIGHTLETMLGIEENNLQMPDIGEIELKSQRRHAKSKITLFTLDKGAWLRRQFDIIADYGYLDSQGRMALKQTLIIDMKSRQLTLEIEGEKLQIRHEDGEILAEWFSKELITKFESKMPSLVLVIADTRKSSNNIEEFHYNEAYLLEKPSGRKFIELVKKGRIVVDLRMHQKDKNTVRNHGTGFRIEEKYLKDCFARKEQII